MGEHQQKCAIIFGGPPPPFGNLPPVYVVLRKWAPPQRPAVRRPVRGVAGALVPQARGRPPGQGGRGVEAGGGPRVGAALPGHHPRAGREARPAPVVPPEGCASVDHPLMFVLSSVRVGWKHGACAWDAGFFLTGKNKGLGWSGANPPQGSQRLRYAFLRESLEIVWNMLSHSPIFRERPPEFLTRLVGWGGTP